MTTQQLNEALGLLDENLINEVLEEDDPSHQWSRSGIMRWIMVSVAALLVICVTAAGLRHPKTPAILDEAPQETIYLTLAEAEKHLGTDLLFSELNSLSDAKPTNCSYTLKYRGDMTERSNWERLWIAATFPDTFSVWMDIYPDRTSQACRERHNSVFSTDSITQRTINGTEVSCTIRRSCFYAEFEHSGLTYILSFDMNPIQIAGAGNSRPLPQVPDHVPQPQIVPLQPQQINGTPELAEEYLEKLLGGET